MKKNTTVLTAGLLLTLFCLFGCDKAAKERDRQTIEEFKNSPRDHHIIGKWKLVDMNLENVQLAVHFRLDGVVENGIPIYDKNNEIVYFKKDDMEQYFYTINDSILITYIISHHLLFGSYLTSEHYKMIHEDTIHLYDSNSESIGIRENDIEIRD